MYSDRIPANDEMLNSWKEVASYLSRGIRTVQRWERDLGLPVRRPRGKMRSAVIAFKPELDRWLLQTPERHLQPTENNHHRSDLHQNTARLTTKTQQLLSRSVDLCARSQQLTTEINRALVLASSRLSIVARKKEPLPVPPPALAI